MYIYYYLSRPHFFRYPMVDDGQSSLVPSDHTPTKPRAGDIALGTPARLLIALNNEYIPLISFEKVVDNTRCVCYIKVMT